MKNVEVVYLVKGEVAPSKSIIQVPEVTPQAARKVLNELLKPTGKKVLRITLVLEV